MTELVGGSAVTVERVAGDGSKTASPAAAMVVVNCGDGTVSGVGWERFSGIGGVTASVERLQPVSSKARMIATKMRERIWLTPKAGGINYGSAQTVKSSYVVTSPSISLPT
jgi:hypothetical protein